MTEVFSALSGLVSAAVRKDWIGAVTSLITLVQAVIKNLPATTQVTATEMLMDMLSKAPHLLGTPVEPNENGSFFAE